MIMNLFLRMNCLSRVSRMLRNCVVLATLAYAGPTVESCGLEKVADRPPPGEDGVDSTGRHYTNSPSNGSPATVSVSAGTGGISVTVTKQID